VISKVEALSRLQRKDGKTIVLAGLVEMEKGESRTVIPFLAEFRLLECFSGRIKLRK